MRRRAAAVLFFNMVSAMFITLTLTLIFVLCLWHYLVVRALDTGPSTPTAGNEGMGWHETIR